MPFAVTAMVTLALAATEALVIVPISFTLPAASAVVIVKVATAHTAALLTTTTASLADAAAI